MPVCLDASATLSWLFDDERDALATAMANAVLECGAIAPSHWRLDVRNALLSAERRRRLKAAEVDAMLRDLGALPIEIVAKWSGNEGELAYARAHRLSLYDAAYLDLAVRRNVPLMTRDESLGAADTLALRWAPGRRRR